jgi:tricorn protease
MLRHRLLACALLAASCNAAAGAYLRFPAICGNVVLFTAEGDLWKAGVAGGAAQRLTTHAAAETNAAISHDGKWIAFSASYEGEQEAYVMPADGGLPKRITFESGGVNVLGWTRQGDVLVGMQADQGPDRRRVVAAVNPGTLARRVFPVSDANDAVLDDSASTLYFTRFGLALTGDNVKRYRGGAHAQLWRYKLDGKSEAEPVFKGESGNARRPMWWNGRLVFISDRGGADQLWSSKGDGSDARAHTANRDWDVRNAALGDGKVAYQMGADIHVLDLASGLDQTLAVSLVSDFDQQRKRQLRSTL